MHTLWSLVWRRWLRVVHEDYCRSQATRIFACFDGNETRTLGGERNVRKWLQQRQHGAFHDDGSNRRTYLSPGIHHQQGCGEEDTNSRAVLVRRKLYSVA